MQRCRKRACRSDDRAFDQHHNKKQRIAVLEHPLDRRLKAHIDQRHSIHFTPL